jgi:hypothetical protein
LIWGEKKRLKKKNILAVLLFFLGVLLFTRIDFLVNSSLYRYGLIFSENWYAEYTSLYALCYQLLILSLFVYSRNLKLLALMEVFALTSTQDLFYFGLWQGSFPTTDWSWTPFYTILGSWTTANQILLSVSMNFTVSLAIILLSLMKQSPKVLSSRNRTPRKRLPPP